MICDEPLNNYLEFISYGFTNPMPDSIEGPWKITAKDVINGNINFDTARKTSKEAYCDLLTNKSKPIIGDVLLTKDGTLGRLAIVKCENICINQSVAVLRANSKITPRFLYYLLSSPKYQQKLLADSDGTTIKHIYITRVAKMLVEVPDLKTQSKIAITLSYIDDKIELNNRMNSTLEEIAQTLFKRWFVDFEFPDENGNPYKSAGGKMVESELGLIPEGWSVQSLGSFLTESKERVGKRNIPEYSITNNGILPRTDKFNKNLSKDIEKNKVTERGQISFGTSRQILSFGVMKDSIGCVSSVYHVFSVNESKYNPFLLETYMRTMPEMFLSLIRPGGRDNQGLDKTQLDFKKLPIPPIDCQNSYIKTTRPFKLKIEANVNELNILIQIRDTLLPKLMSGEIRVPITEVIS